MGKIRGYAKKSDLMNISLIFKSEEFNFNLYEELAIDIDKINTEIKQQPSSYAFLSLLQKKLFKLMKISEGKKDKAYSDIYNKYKEKLNPQTQRPYDKDYASHIANAHPKHQLTLKEYYKVKDDYDTICTCVVAFEQRANLIQTLSANIRKEN
jgi:hypothetical protein